MSLSNVKQIISKSQKDDGDKVAGRFEIHAVDEETGQSPVVLKFRATTDSERDEWVSMLNAHVRELNRLTLDSPDASPATAVAASTSAASSADAAVTSPSLASSTAPATAAASPLPGGSGGLVVLRSARGDPSSAALISARGAGAALGGLLLQSPSVQQAVAQVHVHRIKHL
jgi:hypothetical protein